MANEFKHKDIGPELSRVEWEGIATHEADGETADDMLYFDGANWIRATPATIATVIGLDAKAVAAVEAAGLALAKGKNIKVISALTADHTWSGLTAIMTSRRILILGQCCYVESDSELDLALATATATMPGMAICCEGIAAHLEAEFLLQGFFRDNTWNWTPGGLLYVSKNVAGALTQTAPIGSGEQVQVVGVALTADIIYFSPSLALEEIP